MSKLLPAIKLNGKVYSNKISDHHDSLAEKFSLTGGERGFATNGLFLTRQQAVGYLKVHQPVIYAKIADKLAQDGLHSSELAKAQGVTQVQRKAVNVEKKPDSVDLSKKKMIIYDRGGLTYIAQFMAKYFGEVQYYSPNSELYPKSPQSQVGTGIPGVERIQTLHKNKNNADVIFFPYVFDEGPQAELREQGFPVCGSGDAKTEMNKTFFLELLEKVGLPIPKTYIADGLTDLREYIKGKEKLVLKYAEKWRGDFETYSHINKYATELFLNNIEEGLGPTRKEEVEIQAQAWIKGVETGCDPILFHGRMPNHFTLGTEVKDDGYVCQDFTEMPKIIKASMDALVPYYEKVGYAAPYSNEMRITPSGKVYRTDETLRCGNPPTPTILKMYGKSYAKAIYDMANGIMPTLEPDFKYGVHVNLRSVWYIKHDIHIGCPKDSEDWLKLSNARMAGGQYYCLPVLTEEDYNNFGTAVAASNDSLKAAQDEVTQKIKELCIYKMKYDADLFIECEEELEKCRKIGIPFD